MLNYLEVMDFMKNFHIDCLNGNRELIIDIDTNTYCYIGNCKDIDDVKTMVVMALTRPIYKGLKPKKSKEMLARFNNFFKTSLTKEDFGKLYVALCYESTIPNYKKFIQDGFPMDKLEEYSKNGTFK